MEKLDKDVSAAILELSENIKQELIKFAESNHNLDGSELTFVQCYATAMMCGLSLGSAKLIGVPAPVLMQTFAEALEGGVNMSIEASKKVKQETWN